MIEDLVSKRLGGANFFENPNIYRFTELIQLKKSISTISDKQILDFGIGEPADMADIQVIDTMYSEALMPQNRFYADNGIDDFKIAAMHYMKKKYDVDLDWQTEILPIMGAKSALAYLPLCFVNQGDNVISCSPGYTVLENSAKWLGAKIIHLPLEESNSFYPLFNQIDEKHYQEAKIIYLNYPNNPTGQLPNRTIYENAIKIAERNNIVIVNDAAYLPLVYDKKDRISFLSVNHAKNVGIEIHTLSKGFNMTGWRIGFACGNAKIIKLLATVKDNCDSGQFIPIQKAAIKALESNKNEEMAFLYSQRIEKLSEGLKGLGFNIPRVGGGYYLYIRVPTKVDNISINSAKEFAIWLLTNESIFVIPYDDNGHFIRLSAAFYADNKQTEEQVIAELMNRLASHSLIF